MTEALRSAGAVSSAVVAFLLVVAGVVKLVDPRPAVGSLRRVSSTLSRQPAGRLEVGARALGCTELIAATVSIASTSVMAITGSATVVALCTGFLWFTHIARRRGAACGCWGSLSDNAAGTGEVVRRGVLLIASVVALGAVTTSEARLLPVGVAVAVLAAGGVIGNGVALTGASPRVTALFAAATMGVAVPAGAQRAVSRRVRRSTLNAVRCDHRVGALQAAMPHVRIEWRHARVTSAQRRRQGMANRLVAVPGRGGNLRIVAGPSGVLVAIGESTDAIYTVGDDRVVVADKKHTGDR